MLPLFLHPSKIVTQKRVFIYATYITECLLGTPINRKNNIVCIQCDLYTVEYRNFQSLKQRSKIHHNVEFSDAKFLYGDTEYSLSTSLYKSFNCDTCCHLL